MRLLPCHKPTCVQCQGQWRLRVANKVRQGAARLLVQGQDLHFLTLTLGPGPAGETHGMMVDRLMAAWRRLVQGRWWRGHVGTYFRVVESGTHTGRPHIHAVVAGGLPYVRAARTPESLASWGADLTGEGREMVGALELAGFGPICHAEHLHGGGQGAATYLGGYLSKSEKRLLRPDGRTVRVAEGARDWPGVEHDKTTYMAGAVSVEPGGRPAECVQCGQERQAAAESKDWAALRRRNVAWWWRNMDPNDAGVRADVRAAVDAAETYKAARAAVPPERRHLIGRMRAAPAGAGGRPAEGGRLRDAPGRDAAPVPPDVAGAVWCRRLAVDALERVRRRGYDGSMRLLRDMAAAGFDVEAVVS